MGHVAVNQSSVMFSGFAVYLHQVAHTGPSLSALDELSLQNQLRFQCRAGVATNRIIMVLEERGQNSSRFEVIPQSCEEAEQILVTGFMQYILQRFLNEFRIPTSPQCVSGKLSDIDNQRD